MKTTKELREASSRAAAHAAGAIRRVAISVTSSALWKLLGHMQLDKTRETFEGEPFTGIGFYARPSASGRPEAIVLFPGDDATAPVVVAVRDEKTRQAIAGALAENETAMFNDSALVVCKAAGTIEARSKNGQAVALAKQSDLQALRDHVNALLTGGSGSAAVPAPSVGTGTTVLKGE